MSDDRLQEFEASTGTSASLMDERSSLLGRSHAMEKGWLDKAKDRWNPVLLLENRSSVARDHLASERTYRACLL